MILELRIYWRLRPYIAKLKGLFAMKFSTHLVLQIVLTIMQAINKISDLVPAKYQVYVLGTLTVLQGILALGGQFVNPDGTPAAKPWIKRVILACLLAGSASTVPARAEDLTLGAGIAYNQYVSTAPVNVWGDVEKPVIGNLFSYSSMDISAIGFRQLPSGLNMPILRYAFRSGAGYRLPAIGKIEPFILVQPGIVTSVQATNLSIGGGGGGRIAVKPNLKLGLQLRVNYDASAGTQYIPEFGVFFGGGK